jgi:hypothetical protein
MLRKSRGHILAVYKFHGRKEASVAFTERDVPASKFGQIPPDGRTTEVIQKRASRRSALTT